MKKYPISTILIETDEGDTLVVSRAARIDVLGSVVRNMLLLSSKCLLLFGNISVVYFLLFSVNNENMPLLELVIMKTFGIILAVSLISCLYCILAWTLFNRHYLFINRTMLTYCCEVDALFFKNVFQKIPLLSVHQVRMECYKEGYGFGIKIDTDDAPLYMFHSTLSNTSKIYGKVNVRYKAVWNEYRKIIITINDFLSACTTEWQNQSAQQQTKPAVSIVPAKIETGYVISGSIHDLTLTVFNTAQQDKPLDAVVIDCDCITVEDAPKTIPAESSSPVRLRFTAPQTTGPYTKTITIKSGGESYKARFTARINAPLRTEPKEIIFAENAEIPFTVFNDGTEPVRLLYATAVPALCRVKMPAEPVPPKSRIILTVVLHESVPDRTVVLNIRTNHKFQKSVSVPIQIKNPFPF